MKLCMRHCFLPPCLNSFGISCTTPNESVWDIYGRTASNGQRNVLWASKLISTVKWTELSHPPIAGVEKEVDERHRWKKEDTETMPMQAKPQACQADDVKMCRGGQADAQCGGGENLITRASCMLKAELNVLLLINNDIFHNLLIFTVKSIFNQKHFRSCRIELS